MNHNFGLAIFYLMFGLLFVVFGIRTEVKKRTPIMYGENRKYVERDKLEKVCWSRALKHLEMIENDKEITSAVMILGQQNGIGHAWIEYKRGDEVIKYDPTTDKIIHTTTPTKETNPNENNK